MEDEEETGGGKERGQVRGNKDNTGPYVTDTKLDRLFSLMNIVTNN